MKKGKIIHMFPGSNTPQGFVGFMNEDLEGLERIFILKGGPGCGKSTLMNKIAINMAERGFDVEVWLCSSAPESLDGVFIPDLAVAVVDGTAPHVVEPQYPGIIEEIVNLGEHWNQSQLREHKQEIRQLTADIQTSFARAYKTLTEYQQQEEARAVPPLTEVEQKQLCRGLAEEIFGQQNLRVRKFFAEAMTRNGRQSYAQELSAACRRRYLLQGSRENVGLVLAGLAQSAAEHGHNLDLYYSCLAPDKLEMLIIPGLSVALVDSDCPDLEPRYADILLRLDDADAVYDEDAQVAADTLLTTAAVELEHEHCLHDNLESFYISAMDFEALDAATKDVLGKIWQMAAERG